MPKKYKPIAGIIFTLMFLAISDTYVYAAESYSSYFSTYLGGSLFEQARDIATDSSGNIYVVGGTQSADFTRTVGPVFNNGSCTSLGTGGRMDVFITKYSPNGQIIWSRLFGGPCYDRAYAVEVDDNGYVYIAGRAGDGLPTTAGVKQSSFAGDYTPNGLYGKQDGFAAKINPDGSNVVWATYFGTSGDDIIRDMDIDSQGHVYLGLTGTASPFPPGFITSSAFQTQIKGLKDSVIVKLSPDAKQVLYASYIGGSGSEGNAPSIRADNNGNAYIAFGTNSSDMPVSQNAFQRNFSGNFDIFLAKFNTLANGNLSLVYGTYFGGTGTEGSETHYLEVDGTGTVYLTGDTNSTNLLFNGIPGLYKTNKGRFDSYIAKISPDATKLLAGTYFGGTQGEGTQGIMVDSVGVYFGGPTASNDMPVTNGSTAKGSNDVYVAKFTLNLDSLLFSSYYGGTLDDQGRSLAIDNSYNIISVGQTSSTNYPLKNAAQQTYGGGIADAQVVKFSLTNSPTGTVIPTSSQKPGDANGDGRVDLLDYVIWLGHYGQTTSNGTKDGDFNNDAKVDLLDYVIWLNNFGK